VELYPALYNFLVAASILLEISENLSFLYSWASCIICPNTPTKGLLALPIEYSLSNRLTSVLDILTILAIDSTP
jgi:hypothetical protein